MECISQLVSPSVHKKNLYKSIRLRLLLRLRLFLRLMYFISLDSGLPKTRVENHKAFVLYGLKNVNTRDWRNRCSHWVWNGCIFAHIGCGYGCTFVHTGCGYGCIFVHIGVELELTIRFTLEKLG